MLHSFARNRSSIAPGAAFLLGVAVFQFEKKRESSSADGRFRFSDSQLFKPVQPYPFWDNNWDWREETDETILASVRRSGVSRHIILVRHGQYDETYGDDERRVLTPLGRQQAEVTGVRLAALLESAQTSHQLKVESGRAQGDAPPTSNVVVRLHSSNMARAKETADLIAKHLPMASDPTPSSPPESRHLTVQRLPPNPLLNEGRPCHVVPEGKSSTAQPSMSPLSVHRDGARIETAFRELFHRAKPPPLSQEDKAKVKAAKKAAKEKSPASAAAAPAAPAAATQDTAPPLLLSSDSPPIKSTPPPQIPPQEHAPEFEQPHRHEYEIVVCHGNVIRYMAMRALQLPPEAWLRLSTFNCSLTYLVVRPTGNVSLRTLGDVGHLGMSETTFSGHHGFEW